MGIQSSRPRHELSIPQETPSPGIETYEEHFATIEATIIQYVVVSEVFEKKNNTELFLPLKMRTYLPEDQMPPEFRLNQDNINRLNNDRTKEKLLLGELSKAIKTIIGDEQFNEIKKTYTNIRSAVEKSTPTTQCNNTVNKVNAETMCWICYTPIGAKELDFENGPECEHIFPILQALCFTGLYSTSVFQSLKDKADDEGKPRSQMYVDELSREYRWSHRICNQVKSDTHFIKYDTATLRFEIGENYVKEFLYKLLGTKSYGGGQKLWNYVQRVSKITDKKTWVDGRAKEIIRICKEVTDIANGLGLTKQQFFANTEMKIREYFSSLGTGVPSQIIEVSRSRPTATLGGLQTIPNNTIPILQLYAKSIQMIVSGIISNAIDKLGKRETGLTYIQRAALNEQLINHEPHFYKYLSDPSMYPYFQLIRHGVMYACYYVNKGDERKTWSDIQTLYPIVLYASMLDNTIITYRDTIPNLVSITPDAQTIVSQELRKFYDSKIKVADEILIEKLGKNCYYFIDNRDELARLYRQRKIEGNTRSWDGGKRRFKDRTIRGRKRNKKTRRVKKH